MYLRRNNRVKLEVSFDGQADFVAAYFQIVGGALSQCLADLDLQLLLFSLCGLDQLGGLLVLLDKGQ